MSQARLMRSFPGIQRTSLGAPLNINHFFNFPTNGDFKPSVRFAILTENQENGENTAN